MTGPRSRTVVCGRAMSLEWKADDNGRPYAAVARIRALYMVRAVGVLRRPARGQTVTLCEGWELYAEGGGRYRLYERGGQ